MHYSRSIFYSFSSRSLYGVEDQFVLKVCCIVRQHVLRKLGRSLSLPTCSISAFCIPASNFPVSWARRLRRRFPVVNNVFVFLVFINILFSLAHFSTSVKSFVNDLFSAGIAFQSELKDKVVSSA